MLHFPLLRRIAALLVIVSLPAAAAPDLSEKFFANSGNTVVFLGDSITKSGRYIGDLRSLLLRKYPTLKAPFVNAGLASETTSGLSEEGHPNGGRPVVFTRLQSVLDANKPKLVFACYGMNDGIYHPYAEDRAKAYQDGIQRLVREVKAAGAEIILVSPPVFDSLTAKAKLRDAPPYKWTQPYRNYDSVLGAYGKWETTLRSQEQVVVDLHAHMLAWVMAKRKTNASFAWTSDGIHPGDEGHQAMADAIFAGMFDPTTGIGPARSAPGAGLVVDGGAPRLRIVPWESIGGGIGAVDAAGRVFPVFGPGHSGSRF